MHKQRNIKIARIDRRFIRPRFPGQFHCVTFNCRGHGSVHSSFQVWKEIMEPCWLAT